MAAGTPLVDERLAAAVTALETLAPGQEAEHALTVGTPESPLRDMAEDIKKKMSELEALVKAMRGAERGPGGLAATVPSGALPYVVPPDCLERSEAALAKLTEVHGLLDTMSGDVRRNRDTNYAAFDKRVIRVESTVLTSQISAGLARTGLETGILLSSEDDDARLSRTVLLLRALRYHGGDPGVLRRVTIEKDGVEIDAADPKRFIQTKEGILAKLGLSTDGWADPFVYFTPNLVAVGWTKGGRHLANYWATYEKIGPGKVEGQFRGFRVSSLGPDETIRSAMGGDGLVVPVQTSTGQAPPAKRPKLGP